MSPTGAQEMLIFVRSSVRPGYMYVPAPEYIHVMRAVSPITEVYRWLPALVIKMYLRLPALGTKMCLGLPAPVARADTFRCGELRPSKV